MKQLRLQLLVIVLLFAALPAMAQQKPITLSFNDESLPSALRKLEKASDYKISFAYNDVEKYRVSGQVKNSSFKAALDFLLKGKPLTYDIRDKFVDIKKSGGAPARKNRDITGIVRDEFGEPLPGATVISTGASQSRETSAVVTDMNGHFKLTVASDALQLEVSYVGFETKKVALTADLSYDIALQPDSKTIDEVVVTGVFTRKANTFTGAVTTIKGDDLKKVGNANILQSLKNIDPSFMQVENLGMGSDPNSLPDFQMRGSSTISGVQGEYASSANQPLFILDGFETELTKIMDLDMNQVESVTTLKDATAKAIYGSKAANGVIVIETKKPESGSLRVTYTGNVSLEVPDLTSYDLTNAAEKLEVERLAGLYLSDNAMSQIALDKSYSQKLREVLAGVNTDWLAQPVRTGVGTKHSLYIEGGDKAMQYGVNLSYNNIT